MSSIRTPFGDLNLTTHQTKQRIVGSTKTSDHRSLSVKVIKTTEFRSIQETIQQWIGYITDKTQQVALSAVDSEKVNEYTILADLFQESLGSESKEEKKIHAAQDHKGRLQALTEFTIQEEEVYVDYLLSGPWNLQLDSVSLNIPSLSIRGAGTTLMLSVYQVAQREHKEYLALESFEHSAPYYTKLQMALADDGITFFYPVSSDSIPEKLQAYLPKS